MDVRHFDLTLRARRRELESRMDRIEHDFERQRFTALGNWENFIEDTLVTEWELRASPEKAERARVARSGALRRRRDRGERIEPPRPDVPTDKPLRDGRAVLVLGPK